MCVCVFFYVSDTQIFKKVDLALHFPAEFSSSLDQTHLPVIMILKTLISMRRCVWSELELKSDLD